MNAGKAAHGAGPEQRRRRARKAACAGLAGRLSGLPRAWLLAVIRPSLVRRLLVAQMAMLSLMWVLGIAYLLSLGGRSFMLLESDSVYHTISAISDGLHDRPTELARVLDTLYASISEDYKVEPERRPSFVVEQQGRIVYRSPHAPDVTIRSPYASLTPMHVGGMLYRARTVQAASGTRTTLLAPDDGWNVFLTVYSDGFYLMPLLTSLPFLILPAWLSIRLAMRPWNGVARELAARGPQDLAPLSLRQGHRELVLMVDAINGWMRRVASSSERERSFVADAAHELRTPLAAMLVNIEALRGHATDDAGRQLMSGVLSSGHRATRMVNQLLSLMRSEATEIETVRQVELDRLLQDRLAVLGPLAAARSTELELSAEADVRVDAPMAALASLVDNLVENAIKYGPPGGVVRVTVRREGPEAVLEVEDQGPGIAPALRERVFDRFFRDPAQHEPGSGLGLAIVRSVLEGMGGRIALLDGEHGGLRVEVRLPLALRWKRRPR
jgi:two-component system sensor histidine kinase QseC